jgi:hypothetical protein
VKLERTHEEEKRVKRERHLSLSDTLHRTTARNVSPPRSDGKGKGEKADRGEGRRSEYGDTTRLAKLGVNLATKPSDANGTDSLNASGQQQQHKTNRFSLLPASIMRKIVSPRKEPASLHREPTLDFSKFKSESKQHIEKVAVAKRKETTDTSGTSNDSGTESDGNAGGLHKRNASAPDTIEKNANLHKNKSRYGTR